MNHLSLIKARLLASLSYCVLLMLALLTATSVQASIWDKSNFDFKFATVVSGTTLNLEGSSFGDTFPINAFTELSNDEYRLELRPEISADYNDCHAVLKPRIRGQYFDDMGPFDGETEGDIFFNTASLTCGLGKGFELSVGRQKYLWGNSQFRSPSNPFFAEGVLFNPTDEVTGKDLTILTYRPDYSWEFSIISNWDESHIDQVPNPSSVFISTSAIKIEYLGGNFQSGLILSKRDNKDARLGGFGSLTVNDSFVAYGEFSISSDVDGLLPERDSTGELTRFVVADQVDDKTRATWLLGGSYTFRNDWTAYVEYLHSDQGFNDVQADEWLSLANRGRSFLGTDRMDEGVLILADAFDPLWRQTRQNYAVLQLSRSQLYDKSDIAFQYVRNLDDNSSSASASINYALGDFGELFFVASHNSGGGSRELGRIVNNAFQLGVKIYTF